MFSVVPGQWLSRQARTSPRRLSMIPGTDDPAGGIREQLQLLSARRAHGQGLLGRATGRDDLAGRLMLFELPVPVGFVEGRMQNGLVLMMLTGWRWRRRCIGHAGSSKLGRWSPGAASSYNKPGEKCGPPRSLQEQGQDRSRDPTRKTGTPTWRSIVLPRCHADTGGTADDALPVDPAVDENSPRAGIERRRLPDATAEQQQPESCKSTTTIVGNVRECSHVEK